MLVLGEKILDAYDAGGGGVVPILVWPIIWDNQGHRHSAFRDGLELRRIKIQQAFTKDWR